jgi:hypothetical protein
MEAEGSPNEELARVIAGALAAEGLIPPHRVETTREGLATGTLREGEWRSLLEEGLGGLAAEATDGEWD